MAQAAPKQRAKAAASKAAAPRRGAAESPGSGPAPTLRIVETRILRGPNYWAREPVVRMLVDLGVLEEYPSNKIPGFNDALINLLPSLEDHACSLGRRGGFITRLKEGTWAGHIAEHIALELQNLAGTDVRHGKTRTTGEYGRYNVIFESARRRRSRPAARGRARQPPVAPTDPDNQLDFMPARAPNGLAEPGLRPSTQAILDEAGAATSRTSA